MGGHDEIFWRPLSCLQIRLRDVLHFAPREVQKDFWRSISSKERKMAVLNRCRTRSISMRLCGLSLLMLSVVAIGLCQETGATGRGRGGRGAPNSGANAPTLNYKLVDWPLEAKSAAGFPA